MHLAFITNLYPPYVVGGNEMLCDEVVRSLRDRGHRVSVLCGRGRGLPVHPDLEGALEIDLDRKEETFLGGRVPTAGEAVRLHLFSPASYRTTRRWLRERPPDVVVVWNLYMASLAPLVAARRSGLPVVVHVCDKWLYFGLYDLEPLLQPVAPWKLRAVRFARLTVQPLLRRLAGPLRVVAISEFMKGLYVRAGLAPAQVDVIHLGVPTAEFAAPVRAPRPAGGRLNLLFAGALWAGKGPQTAVRAVGRLARAGLDVHLDLCGGGNDHFVAFLDQVIAEEGVAAQVTFHGRVGRDAVRRFCQTCEVLLFPSEWDEPFAAVPVEAMSSGMAVVATTAGGTPEAITDGETGLLVPPGDPDALAEAVRRLALDDALRLRLGRAAAQVARERFDIASYIDRPKPVTGAPPPAVSPGAVAG
jgi:glycosyltransferase involved in cell wall biosynthesis